MGSIKRKDVTDERKQKMLYNLHAKNVCVFDEQRVLPDLF